MGLSVAVQAAAAVAAVAAAVAPLACRVALRPLCRCGSSFVFVSALLVSLCCCGHPTRAFICRHIQVLLLLNALSLPASLPV